MCFFFHLSLLPVVRSAPSHRAEGGLFSAVFFLQNDAWLLNRLTWHGLYTFQPLQNKTLKFHLLFHTCWEAAAWKTIISTVYDHLPLNLFLMLSTTLLIPLNRRFSAPEMHFCFYLLSVSDCIYYRTDVFNHISLLCISPQYPGWEALYFQVGRMYVHGLDQ